MERKELIFNDNTEGPQWVTQYVLSTSDIDDSFDEEIETSEVIFHATDFETAVKYSQQYLRKMTTEEDTKDTWKDAQIVSIEQY